MLIALRMLLFLTGWFAQPDIFLRCTCGRFLTGCFSHVRRSLDYSTVGWTLQCRRRRIAAPPPSPSPRSVCAWFISCCLHVSSVEFVLFLVNAVCFAHAFAFSQVGLHNRHFFAPRMRLISDGLFFPRLTFFRLFHCWMDLAAPPPSHPTLPSQRSVCAWFISCCWHVSSVDFVCFACGCSLTLLDGPFSAAAVASKGAA